MGGRNEERDDPSGITTDHGSVGRVEVDSRGNSVWRWARDALDSTSILLKRLENKRLSLESTQKIPVARDATPAKSAPRQRTALRLADSRGGDRGSSGGGFDPYNSRR